MDGTPSTGQIFPVAAPVQVLIVPDQLTRYAMVDRSLMAWQRGWNAQKPAYPVYQNYLTRRTPVIHTGNVNYTRTEVARRNRDRAERQARIQRAQVQQRPAPQPVMQERSNPLENQFFREFQPRIFEDHTIMPRWVRF